ncbi:MAG: sugar phosphate nucleotidyltransferase [marine benthic group bacterium]|nr:sugar phosphate nucleotidyltransferase [Gemmatimonadota bacterium]
MSDPESQQPGRYAVILAGGIGSRFWPASTPIRPKQLLPLGGERPLILETVDRARRLVGKDRVRILTGHGLVDPFRRAVPDLDEDEFLVEPIARSTGPALVWAAQEIETMEPGALMISLHSDHVIQPFEEFENTIDRACRAATERHGLVCLGIEPARPETGYGYIETGEDLGEGVSSVLRFHEKPDAATAAEYASSGRFLWNSGIFVWRARDLLEEAANHAHEMKTAFPQLQLGDLEAYFRTVEPVSVDVGVLERSDRVEVARASFAWDDVGTWSALDRTRRADEHGNVVVGDASILEGSGNVVWAEDGPVRLFGVDDLVVVRSSDEVLVMPKSKAADLKRFITYLETP